MSLNKKQKKYLKGHLKTQSLEEIAKNLGVGQKDLEEYLKKIWRPQKVTAFLALQEQKNSSSLQNKINRFRFKNFLQENRRWFWAIILTVIIVYANGLGGEFLSDDIGAIAQNENLDNFSYVTQNFPAMFRPFLYFVINQVFGRHPLAFKVLSLVFHSLAATGLAILASLLLNKTVGIIAGFIFAVHPLLTEAVTWISGDGYSQYGAFLIWATIFYLLSFKEKKYYWFCLGAFLLALGSSEKAMAFPFLLLALVITHWQDLGKNRSWQKLIAPSLIGLGWIVFYLTKVPERLAALETNYYQDPNQAPPFSFKLPVAIASYLGLFFWPKNLTFYHSEIFFSKTEFIIIVGACLAFLALTAYLFFSSRRRLSFWPLWFLASLAPVLSPFDVAWIVAERYVYLGAAGLTVMVSYLLALLFQKEKTKPWGVTIISLLIIALGARTIIRNLDWKNQDNLWLATAKTSPSSPQNHNNLGDLWARRGDLDRAIEEFQIAINLNPRYADAYHNLANIYQQKGDWQKALENYQKAVAINPAIWQSWQNMAAIYYEQKDFKKAKEMTLKLLEVKPDLPYLYQNLGLICYQLNQLEEAKKYLEIAQKVNPQNKEIENLLLKIKKQEEKN